MAGHSTLTYKPDAGLEVLVTATTVEETGVNAGELYEFVSTDPCLVRWGTDDASAADAGFDFCVPANFPIRARVPNGITAVNIIEASTASAATAACFLSQVEEVV